MLVHVVDPLVPGPPATTESPNIDGAEDIQQVAWVPVPFRLQVRSIGNYLSEAAPSWLIRQVNLVILGTAHAPPNDLRTWAGVHHRLENRPIVVAHQDVVDRSIHTVLDASIHPDASGLVPPQFHRDLLDRLRTADVLAMMGQSTAALPPHESVHYLGPDGESHYASFLRVGLALRSSDEYDRLSFWLAPHLAGARSLLVDHWAMMGVAQHAANYANRLLNPNAAPAAVTGLRRYDESIDELVSRLRRELTSEDRRNLAILVSVIGSGHLMTRLREVARRLGESPKEVAICASPSSVPPDLPVLAHLPDDFQLITDCEDCRSRRTLVPIEPDSYLLQLAAFTKHEKVDRQDAHAARKFFEATGAHLHPSAVVHRTHSDGRHQAFYVDVGPLLESPVFLSRLRSESTRMAESMPDGNVDLLICPSHQVATQLATKIGEHLNLSPLVVDERGLDSIVGPDRDRLLQARSICVVDDVVITGSRLLGYRNRIIELRRRAGLPREQHVFELGCVVGVARPRHFSSLLGIMDITHHREATPRFFAVGELFLPNWDDSQCPWCQELEILENIQRGLPEPNPYLGGWCRTWVVWRSGAAGVSRVVRFC